MRVEIPKYFMLNGKTAFPNVTCENFLIDIINSSKFFRSKCSFTEYYVLTTEQSHGEPDAYTKDYQLDFKLLIGEDVMRTRNHNMPEVDYSQSSQGFIFVKTKPDVEVVPDETILLDIKNCTLADLRAEKYANNIKSVVKNIKKKKNLFMYYPYEYLDIKEPAEYDHVVSSVREAFKNLLTYRDELDLGKDTFVCIKVNKNFEIYEWYEGELIRREQVNEIFVSNYRDLRTYSVY